MVIHFMKNKKIYRCYYSLHVTTKETGSTEVVAPICMETASTLTELNKKMELKLSELIKAARGIL